MCTFYIVATTTRRATSLCAHDMAASTVGNPFVPRGDAGEARAAVQARLALVRQRLAEEVESDRDAHANRVTFGNYDDDDGINDVAQPSSSMYANGEDDDDDAFYANLPYGGGGVGDNAGDGEGDGDRGADVRGDDANRGYGGGDGGGGGGGAIDFNGTQRTPAMGRSRGRWQGRLFAPQLSLNLSGFIVLNQ